MSDYIYNLGDINRIIRERDLYVDVLNNVEPEVLFFWELLLKNITTFEFQISSVCQNKCKYCYRPKFDVRYVQDIVTFFQFKTLFQYTIKSFGIPIFVKFFGGDSIVDSSLILEIIKWLNYNYPNIEIIIPTNGRLILEDSDFTRQLLRYKNVHISISLDGVDVNRPLSNYGIYHNYNVQIDYNKVFQLIKSYVGPSGFSQVMLHPMLYFKTSNLWYDQWMFFMQDDTIAKNIGFLEVRETVSINDIKSAVISIKQIIESGVNIDKGWLLNYPTIITGIPACTLQQTIHITMTGYVYACHRLEYDPFLLGNVFNFKTFNLNKMFFIYRIIDLNQSIQCSNCPIKKVCLKNCIAERYESSNNILDINKELCYYYYIKVYLISKYIKHDDYYKLILQHNHTNKKFLKLLEVIK